MFLHKGALALKHGTGFVLVFAITICLHLFEKKSERRNRVAEISSHELHIKLSVE